MGPKPKPAREQGSKPEVNEKTLKPHANGIPPGNAGAEQLLLTMTREPVVVVQASSYKVVDCNPAATTLYGFSREELVGKSIIDLSPERERDIAFTRLQRTLGGRHEFHHVTKTGTSIYVEFDPVPIRYQGSQALLCVIHDITERSRLIRALLESDARNREIIENASDIIYTHDLKGNFTSGNRAVTKIMGYTPDEYLTMSIRGIVHPGDLEKVQQSIAAKTRGEPHTNPYLIRAYCKDRRLLTLEVNTRLVLREDKPIGVQGVARDVTDRVRMEEALRESETKFRVMAESAPCAILIVQDWKYKYVNPMSEKLTGYTAEELYALTDHTGFVHPNDRESIRKRFQARMSGVDVENRYEFRIVTKQGETRNMDATVSAISYEGRPAAVCLVFDVTERRKTDKEIYASEFKFRELFHRNLAGVYLTTVDGSILDCNDSCAHMLGFSSREEMLKHTAYDLYFDSKDRQVFIDRLRRSRSYTNLETFMRRKDGKGLWILENAALLEDPAGGPTMIQGTMVDITERKQAEEMLRESQKKFRAVADTAASAIYIHDGSRFLYVNRACEEISGYSASELLQMSPLEIVHREDRALVTQRAQLRREGDPDVPTRYEYRMVHKNGSARWLDFSATSIEFEGEAAILATAFDITKRKIIEQLQSALYRIAEGAAEAQDLQAFFRYVHGIITELMYAKNLYIALYDSDRQRLSFPYYVDEFDQAPAGEVPLGRGATEYVLRNGQPVLLHPADFNRLGRAGEMELVGSDCVDWIGAPLKTSGKVFGVIAAQTYSEKVRYGEQELEILSFVAQHLANAILRRRNEDALRQSEQRYRSLVESAVYGIYRSSPDDHFIDVNPALVRMLGYDSAEEMLGLVISKDVYADPEERNVLISRYGHLGRLENIEVKWKRKDNRIITVRLSGRTVNDEHGKPYAFEMIVEDVTERRALENQLRQSQKMEAIGRLAGGVAHDFNNLLTVIKGYTELMLEELKTGDPLHDEAEEICKAAERAAGLTRQLLAFSRQQVLAPKVLDLNSIVSNMDKLLKRLLGADIDLKTALEADLGSVKADPGQIEQVLMNLAVNARDAMPLGGKLTIETANVELDGEYARDHVGAEPGSYVMIAVSDTGMGMSDAVRQRIFEPFFTTKEAGKGTGLGLSTVYGIVKQSGGYVWVYSEVGVGTSFKVYLPRVDELPERFKVEAPRPSAFAGHETVLLVEDEDGVRALVRQVLQKHGYTVLEARHGGEALLHCERYKSQIDLLLTDVVLEEMPGPELAKRLLSVRPRMKVLYISGYTDDAIIHHGVMTADTAFLQKPFTTEALAKKIRQVLEN